MRNRLFKLALLSLAAAGGVAVWQRKNETPPTAPVGASLRPSEPFMDPVTDRTPAATAPATTPTPAPLETASADDAASAVDGGPAADVGVVADARPTPLPDPPHGPFTTAPDGPADDLKRISGVGPKLEQMLNEQGITTFRQLAALSEDDVDALQSRLPQFPGRIRRDDWVNQAAQLAQG